MRNRKLRLIIQCVLFFVATGPLKVSATSSERQKRPNILFVMTDQQYAGMMSCAGNKWLSTPSLDRLAASGIRFDRAYASNPVCAPSRFSLQTGLMPSAIGMKENKDCQRVVTSRALMDQSLGSLFEKAGYELAYGGKIHLPDKMNRIENMGYRRMTGDSREKLAAACVEFIKSPHDKPFLLFASFVNPHDICFVRINDRTRAEGKPLTKYEGADICERLLDRARKSPDLDDFINKNCPPVPSNHDISEEELSGILGAEANTIRQDIPMTWSEQQWRLHRWVYCRLTETVDEEIGTVLDALKEAGLEDNTLVVFTSDHGEMNGAHKMAGKSMLYEESVNIPLILSYKGVIPTALVDDKHLVCNGIDLLPTICDYAGVKAPEGLPGKSLRTLVQEKSAAWRDFVVSETYNGRMLRTGDFKYCIYDSGGHNEHLYDLKKDPGEMKNVADDPAYRDVLDRHRNLLKKWTDQTGKQNSPASKPN